METIDEKEKFILCHRFGLSGCKQETLEQVGKKLGVTRERIRQLQNIALSKLRRAYDQEEFENEQSAVEWMDKLIQDSHPDMDLNAFAEKLLQAQKSLQIERERTAKEREEQRKKELSELHRQQEIQEEETRKQERMWAEARRIEEAQIVRDLESRVLPNYECPKCKGHRIADLFAIWERSHGQIVREVMCLDCRYTGIRELVVK